MKKMLDTANLTSDEKFDLWIYNYYGNTPPTQNQRLDCKQAWRNASAEYEAEIIDIEKRLRESQAMAATLSHAARVSHRWEQAEIDKVKARARAALEEPK